MHVKFWNQSYITMKEKVVKSFLIRDERRMMVQKEENLLSKSQKRILNFINFKIKILERIDLIYSNHQCQNIVEIVAVIDASRETWFCRIWEYNKISIKV